MYQVGQGGGNISSGKVNKGQQRHDGEKNKNYSKSQVSVRG